MNRFGMPISRRPRTAGLRLLLLAGALCLLRLPSAADAKIKWACIGTGITAGNPSATVSYVRYLDTSRLGPQDTVLNFGVSGATLLKRGDTSYWSKPQLGQLIAAKPSIVTIELGSYDTKPANWQYGSDFATDLVALVDTLRTSIAPAPRIWLLLPPPIYANTAGLSDSILTSGVIPLINQVANVLALPVADLNTPLKNRSSLFSAGGIFPTTAGCDSIALTISRAYLNSVTRIACIGNSITHYLGTTTANMNPADAYPSKLNMMLGPDYSVKNFGNDGAYMQKSEPDNNPYWKLGRWPAIFAMKPNIVTICLGTNDSRAGDWNTNQSGTHVPNQYITDYKAFIDTLNQCISPRPKIFLCLPMPSWKYNGAWNHDHGHGGINGDIIRDSILPAIRSVAADKGLQTIDLWTPLSGDSIFCLYDGIHPNSVGEDTIAHVIYRTVSTVVGTTPSVPATRPTVGRSAARARLSVRLSGRGQKSGAALISLDGRMVGRRVASRMGVEEVPGEMAREAGK